MFFKGAFGRLDPTGSFREQAPKKLTAGRLGEPEELANLAAYLLSDYSSWMNGSVRNFSVVLEFCDFEFCCRKSILTEASNDCVRESSISCT